MVTNDASSRRDFLKTAVAALARTALLPSLASAEAPRTRLRELDYAAVRLTGGPLKDHYDRVLASFLALDNDRLLKVYRQRAGLPAPGEDMGGWYDADGFVPGHTLGQYISGLARYARATGERAANTKIEALVSGYAKTIGPDGFPYASKHAAELWPCYVLDKYEFGLLDAYRLAGVQLARELLPRVIRGALPYLPERGHDRNGVHNPPYDETYVLPENLFRTYEVTGDQQFLDLAKRYLLDSEYFVPLAQGKNVLPGKHGYSHVMALSSAAKAYLVLGDTKYLAAMKNAWEMLAATQQFTSGGWAPQEMFVEPYEGKLYDSLQSTHEHFETPCGSFAHMKLARYLIEFTGDARYGDGLERVLYNTILGAKDPDGEGNFFYYSDYQANAQKGYYKAKWPCCSGTLVQGVADYPLNVYFAADNGICVNLFTPSEVIWRCGIASVKLTQNTGYPHDGAIELRVEVPAATAFTVYVRVPGWLRGAASIAVNGKAASVAAEPGTFAAIRRTWKRNDTIEITFPLGFRTEAIDNRHPETVAVMRGALMFVAVTPPANLATTPLRLPAGLEPLGGARGIYKYNLPQQTLRFRPFFAIHNETYSTYFRTEDART